MDREKKREEPFSLKTADSTAIHLYRGDRASSSIHGMIAI
jgi:hypothetical protein